MKKSLATKRVSTPLRRLLINVVCYYIFFFLARGYIVKKSPVPKGQGRGCGDAGRRAP